jgi:hypothetical protein
MDDADVILMGILPRQKPWKYGQTALQFAEGTQTHGVCSVATSSANLRWYGRRKRRLDNAGWSSPVARQAHNLKAAGSNPAPATNHPHHPKQCPSKGLFAFKQLPKTNRNQISNKRNSKSANLRPDAGFVDTELRCFQ